MRQCSGIIATYSTVVKLPRLNGGRIGAIRGSSSESRVEEVEWTTGSRRLHKVGSTTYGTVAVANAKVGRRTFRNRTRSPGVASSHHIIGRGAAQPELQALQPHALDTLTFTPCYYNTVSNIHSPWPLFAKTFTESCQPHRTNP